MKHINVAILTSSPIIETAIVAYISRLPIDVNIDIVPIEDSVKRILKIEPSILITEPMALSIDQIRILREELSTRLQIVAIYHTALPPHLIKAYDITLSIYESSDVITETLSSIISNRDEEENLKKLSEREKDVLIGIAKGLSNKEIAQELNVSVNTIMTHRRNIVSKLQIHSPAGLTIYAIVSKLVRIDEIKTSIPI